MAENIDESLACVSKEKISIKPYAHAVCLLVNEDQPFFHGSSLSTKSFASYAKSGDYQEDENAPLCKLLNNKKAIWPVSTIFAISRNRFITTYTNITKTNSMAAEYADTCGGAEVENLSSDADIIKGKLRIVSGYYKSTAESDSPAPVPGDEYTWQVLKVKSITRSLSSDLAVIETEDYLSKGNCFPNPANQSDINALRVGKSVVVAGYPLGLPLRRMRGEIANLNTEHLDTFEIKCNAFPGAAGSPVFSSETGKLIGVLLDDARDPVLVPNIEPVPPKPGSKKSSKGTDTSKDEICYKLDVYDSDTAPSRTAAWISNVVPLQTE